MGGRQCRRGRPRAGGPRECGTFEQAVRRRFAARVLQTGNAAPALLPGVAERGQPPPTGSRAAAADGTHTVAQFRGVGA